MMAVIKCEVCGGELELNADMSVGICKYCEAVNVISKNLDRIGNLFNRAIFLRQNKEFDKAMSVYEDILKEDNSDAKAHWGLVLSKYGIEYVRDSRTGKYLPTCHRMQKESLLSDADYLAAIENADFEGKRVYEWEGKRINEIHAKILEISRKEPPYDVFICYKETDNLGRRTEDSIIAQDIYYELEKKGYKTFFSRKTLESKLGSEYEPVIFAALNSAKVMVVVGTKKEHFEAVWVRNEWNRFYKMSKDADKVIIPAYKGISPYELPVELVNYQSLDMSKIGFIQDLLDGIGRYTRQSNKEVSNQKIEKSVNEQNSKSLERLLQNAQTYLKLNNYIEAVNNYTIVTKEYPEDYRGWWGLIICKTKNFNNIQISQSEKNQVDLWYTYVKQLVPINKKKECEDIYVDFLKKMSVLIAKDDENNILKKISEYNAALKSTKENIEKLNVNLEKREQGLPKHKEEVENEIAALHANVKKCEKRPRLYKRIVFTALIVIPLWVIFLIFIGPSDPDVLEEMGVYGIVSFIFIGGFVFSAILIYLIIKLPTGEDKLLVAKKQEDDRKKAYEVFLYNFQQYQQQQNEEIKKNKKKEDKLKEHILNCQNYLSLGKEKREEYWHSELCKKVEVIKEQDKNVVYCRKQIFTEEK